MSAKTPVRVHSAASALNIRRMKTAKLENSRQAFVDRSIGSSSWLDIPSTQARIPFPMFSDYNRDSKRAL